MAFAALAEVGEGSAVSGEDRTVPVSIADPACGRFTATVISGVRVHPSPEWMVRRLEALGMRAINNVVDVSNYVMLELGQPNHAYDLSTIGGGFSVRMARDGETLTTLDDVERSCTVDDLLICDGNDVRLVSVVSWVEPIARFPTRRPRWYSEIAWFAPLGIMKTASRHGLRSEASARYERGVDPALADRAVQRFAELLSLTCPDLVVHAGGADERSSGMPELVRSVGVRISEVNRILGTDLVAADLPGLLDPIGFAVTANGDDVAVTLPSWRPDSTSEIDVIEEIARHHGYGRLGRSVPKPTGHGHLSQAQIRRRLLRDVLVD